MMMNMRISAIIGALTIAVAFAIGIIIGHFAIPKTTSNSNSIEITKKSQRLPISNSTDEKTYRTFINSVQAKKIEENLKDLSSRPHMAGLPEDLESALVIENRWKQDGLTVFKSRYNVLLSYPDENNTNRVTLRNNDGTILLQTSGIEKVYDIKQAKTVNPFLAYSPNGTATSTKLYYANYGRLSDLQRLASKVGNESLRGSIIIMRYGLIYRGDKVMHAQYFGAIGAILYSDPIDYAPFGITPNQTYVQKWYLPSTGAQRGSTMITNGDPLTPTYPSTDYMYRVNEESLKSLPKIPAQPIGYAEAQILLQHMTGESVTVDWRGSLPNTEYRYGGILENNATVEIKSFNRRERRDTYNVIGIMKGDVEPDRYVVIGNHRDAWSLGALDPTSGTATLLEMTRVLGEMHRNGFRPRRSIMFCSWGAEEYGLIGSLEYIQEYVKVLGARVISYLNMDTAVKGNYSVAVKSSPMLYDVILEASKMVPSAYDSSGMTIYDKWMKVNRNNETNEPKIKFGLGSASDYYGFDQLVGSSNFDTHYDYNPKEHGNIVYHPLYHTSYETFYAMKKFIDPEFLAHRTMCQFVGVLSLMLSEKVVLPLRTSRYAETLQNTMKNLQPNNSKFDILRSAVNDFEQSTRDFEKRAALIDSNNPYEVRAYNDQLLQLERAFLNPLGQGEDYTDYKHIIYAPAKGNIYDSSGFPAISHAMTTGNQTLIEKEIAIAVFFVRGALSTLKSFNQFIFQ